MEALAKLERIRTQLLQHISNLEYSVLSQHFSENLSMKIAFPAFIANDFSFKSVPSGYYESPLEALLHRQRSIHSLSVQKHRSVRLASEEISAKISAKLVMNTMQSHLLA